MDDSEPRLLGPADVPAAMALSTEAGWNQTEDDWRVFLARGVTFGIEAGGRVVATAAALPYEGFGFVAMVLTATAYRGRGFATALLAQAVAALTQAGLVPVLDATPAGRPVYERQGFVAIEQIQRWVCPPPLAEGARGRGRHAPVPAASPPHPNPPPRGGREEFRALDAEIFGTSRAFLFDDFLQRLRTICLTSDDGFVISRTGRLATQIGPLVAADEPAAIVLLENILARLAPPLIIDVPSRWSALADALAARGFTPQRAFTRMALGRDTPFGDPARLFATAGPEFG